MRKASVAFAEVETEIRPGLIGFLSGLRSLLWFQTWFNPSGHSLGYFRKQLHGERALPLDAFLRLVAGLQRWFGVAAAVSVLRMLFKPLRLTVQSIALRPRKTEAEEYREANESVSAMWMTIKKADADGRRTPEEDALVARAIAEAQLELGDMTPEVRA